MIIYNITFMVERSEKERFILWIKGEGLQILLPEGNDLTPRLTLLRDVPGDPEFAQQACSFALQLSFADTMAMDGWASEFLPKGIALFQKRFGAEHALHFATVLEEIPL